VQREAGMPVDPIPPHRSNEGVSGDNPFPTQRQPE
jgi:hypothetical protein